MWIELFLLLLLAHLLADFVLQTTSSCRSKTDEHWRSVHQYIHATIVFLLAWLASWRLDFWWGALIVGGLHLAIDIWKSYKKEDIIWFSLDQFFHLLVLAAVAFVWCRVRTWTMPSFISPKVITVMVSALVCWKPANIFIKLALKHYSVNMPEDNASGFNAGALIGTIERWLILIFVCLQRYDALGLLIAAKSIIRFSDSQTNKTEYVLAGTLLSIFIAILCGLFIVNIEFLIAY